MLYNVVKNEDADLEQCISSALQEYCEYFELTNYHSGVCVFLFDKNVFDELKRTKEDYVVAFAKPLSNLIFVCKQSDIKDLYNEEDYKKLIKHEIVHVIVGILLNFNRFIPRWLNEGIARYLSKQTTAKDVCQNIDTLFDNDVTPHVLYTGGGLFIKYLVETYSRETFLSFLTSLKDITSSEEVYNNFKTIYKKDVKEILQMMIG